MKVMSNRRGFLSLKDRRFLCWESQVKLILVQTPLFQCLVSLQHESEAFRRYCMETVMRSLLRLFLIFEFILVFSFSLLACSNLVFTENPNI